ncbi:HD domain-containing protein [Paludibacterium yongneupense]|uniref:HD domain-containing protein n=1 Tax=Paludibacterium yongneupense TaxID=400061 RepID=UPI00042570DB|nr:HD domain-containing protein [Paludibacterium yongneupense]
MTGPELNEWRLRLESWLGAQPTDGDAAHDMAHLRRVWNTARRLLPSFPAADALVVLAACYLHDLVNLPKNDPRRALASRLAAERSHEVLAGLGFPAERIAAVAHAIEAHSFSAAIEPLTEEACIVQDADRMDALGAVGLARMFYVSGRLERKLAHADDPLAAQRPLDDLEYALDHIEVKLARLPAMMRTRAGAQLAETRLQRILAFREQFIDEWGGAN